jgi:tRNA threonylcarbamoyladenosine biosynthesis protein TsaB
LYILAIDSATPVAGLALLNDQKVIREEFINFRKTHSETLMPGVDQMMRDCEIAMGDLSAIAVTIGPGSFTGLRIGLATAKGLSMASGRPLIGISTLDVLASNIVYSDNLVCPLLDARKQEIYTAFYAANRDYPRRLTQDLACSPQEAAARARDLANSVGKSHITLLGDGFYPYEEYFREYFQEDLQVAPGPLMLPRAAALGSLAWQRARNKSFDDTFALRPVYVRLSEAEYRLGKGEL